MSFSLHGHHQRCIYDYSENVSWCTLPVSQHFHKVSFNIYCYQQSRTSDCNGELLQLGHSTIQDQ